MISFLLCVLLQAGMPEAGILTFTQFRTPAEVETAMATLVATYPRLCAIQDIGNAYGQPIKAIKISDNVLIPESEEGQVVLLGLLHADEWISTEMALYLADEILAKYATDQVVKNDVDALEIFIVPIANPEGHRYTASHDRLWRKNRRDSGGGVYGVDLNRNWGYKWGLDSGSSGLPTSNKYRGPAPMSEPETQAVLSLLESLTRFRCLMTYHSSGQYFLRPWIHSHDRPPGMLTLDNIVARSIKRIEDVHGMTYDASIGVTASGELTDYVWSRTRRAAFTTELRPTGSGVHDPDPAIILPNNEENLPAALALLHDAAHSNLWLRDHETDSGVEPSSTWNGSRWVPRFWNSPDIWTVPADVSPGSTVKLVARVRNSTVRTVGNARIDFYEADPLYAIEFPGKRTRRIGSVTAKLPPGTTEVSLPWVTPSGTNSWSLQSWSVGVVISHDTDLPLTTLTYGSSNISRKDFHWGSGSRSWQQSMMIVNSLDTPSEVQASIVDAATGRSLGAVTLSPSSPRASAAIRQKLRLLGLSRLAADSKTSVTILTGLNQAGSLPDSLSVDLHYALVPLVSRWRVPIGSGYTLSLKK